MINNTSLDHQLLQNIITEKNKRRQIEARGYRDQAPNFKAISEALDVYYFVNKLQTYCGYLSYKNIVQTQNISYTESDFLLIPHIKNAIVEQDLNHPTLLIYKNISLLLEEIGETSAEMDVLFKTTLEQIKNNEAVHSKEENLEMYSLLNNYCIRRLNENQDKRKMYRQQFIKVNNNIVNLRYRGISKKAIQMEAILYRNIVVTALAIDEGSFFAQLSTLGLQPKDKANNFRDKLEWTEQFMAFYGDKLPTDKTSQYYHWYCEIFFLFSQKEFTKAYNALENKMRIQGAFLNLDIKILHLKILYEMTSQRPHVFARDKIEIEKVLDAYRNLIKYEKSKRQQVAYQLTYYENFEKVFKKLLRFFTQYDGQWNNTNHPKFLADKQAVKDLITAKNFSYNEWLLEKLKAIQ